MNRSVSRSIRSSIVRHPRRASVTLLAAWAAIAAFGCSEDDVVETPVGPTAFYLTMRDGVRIAVDLWLPAGASASGRVPTIMRATRYSRDREVFNRMAMPETDTEREAKDLVKRGYAHVVVDARGSSASFGTRGQPWGPDEAADYGEIVDWIAAQPWSNGRVASVGTSYDGNTAEMIGTRGRAAVKVMVPRFAYPDIYTDIVFPGGIFNRAFVQQWLSRNLAFDNNDICLFTGQTGADCQAVNDVVSMVKSVDGDRDRTLLGAALREHGGSPDQFSSVDAATHADDRWNGVELASISPGSRWPEAEATQTAVLAWASWMDLGTASGALNRWKNTNLPMTLILGPWNHGANMDSSVYAPREAPLDFTVEQQHEVEMDFIARYLKDASPPPPVRKIVYFTMGESARKETAVWPPAGTVTKPFYLQAEHVLSATPPTVDATDRYAVDFSTSTGADNGWWTKLTAGDVFHEDRRVEDQKLLVYTTAPLAADTEITGHASVTLYLSSTETDGAVFAYLEDVAPDGKVTYITEGQLRLLHRKVCVSGPASPYGPCHSYLSRDAAAMPPGVVQEVRIGLAPTSALVKAGHALRIAVAGHDASTFARVPATGAPVLTVAHGPAYPSRIELPIASRP